MTVNGAWLDSEWVMIEAVQTHLLSVYEVVVDDVVLRTWGNRRNELTYRLLCGAIAAAGGDPRRGSLVEVAAAVAHARAVVSC